MVLPENEVHVWSLNIDDFYRDIELYKNYLSGEEITKANKFKFELDKTVSVMARCSLRMLSSNYLGCNAGTLNFKYGIYGKPDYNFPSVLKFNVSHSGKMVVLAFVKNSEVGVDIEKIKTDFDVMDLAENFFSKDEIAQLRSIKKSDLFEAFYRCWTRKESFIKAKGSGLSFPLASFSVSLDKEEAKLLKTEWSPSEKEEWRLFSFEPNSGYIGALTVAGHIQKVSYHTWDFSI